MTLEQITIAFLIAVFVAAEIYRMRRGMRGVIVGVSDSADTFGVLPVMSVRVRLNSGREVEASLNACTACLGRLQVGDEVRVADTRDGWTVDLPWFRGRFCTGSGRSQQ